MYVPALHKAHDDALVELPYAPIGHLVHDVNRPTGEYVPGKHDVHDVVGKFEYDMPLAHNGIDIVSIVGLLPTQPESITSTPSAYVTDNPPKLLHDDPAIATELTCAMLAAS